MACHLFGAKPLPEPMLAIVKWTLNNKFQWNFNWNPNIFIPENALDNVVCEMGAILFTESYVSLVPTHQYWFDDNKWNIE